MQFALLVIIFGALGLFVYLLLGMAAVIAEFEFGIPGLWASYVRKMAHKRKRLTRAFVLFAWPICLAILIVLLPVEFMRFVISIINDDDHDSESKTELEPTPGQVVQISTKSPVEDSGQRRKRK